MFGKELQGGHLEGDEMRKIAAKIMEAVKEKEKAEVAMRAPPAVTIIGDFQVVGGKKMRKVELLTRVKGGVTEERKKALPEDVEKVRSQFKSARCEWGETAYA